MKLMKTPIILLILLVFFWQCDPKENTETKNTQPTLPPTPEAMSLDGKPLYLSEADPATQRSRDSLLTLASRNYELDSTRVET